jgi:hypothetical protein
VRPAFKEYHVRTIRNAPRLAVGLAAWILQATFAAAADLPAGWVKAGSHPAEYEMGVDTTIRHDGGKGSGFVKATASELHGFGTLMQTATPGGYRGKRVRLSGFVKSENVQSGWAGLWFRIDGPKQGEVLGFDNMEPRAIKGTTDWTRYEIVLDVPETAAAMAFGVLLAGNGQVWMDDLKFEVVPSTTPVTGSFRGPRSAPQNLDFEK